MGIDALDINIFRLTVSAFAQNLFQHGTIREARIQIGKNCGFAIQFFA